MKNIILNSRRAADAQNQEAYWEFTLQGKVDDATYYKIMEALK